MTTRQKIAICTALLIALVAFSLLFVTSKNGKHSAIASENKGHTISHDRTCRYKFVSWNLENFGRSKTDAALQLMVQVLRDADIVAIQEVNAGNEFGVGKVGEMVDMLKNTGADWDYIVSDPTLPHSLSTERYAYLLKKSTTKFSRRDGYLVEELRYSIEREPYMLRVRTKDDKEIALFTMHAVPTAKHPLREVQTINGSSVISSQQVAIFSGDFNLGWKDTDPVFLPMGYSGHIRERTSLKSKFQGNGYLSHQYDNIYTKGLKVCASGVIDFVQDHFSPVTEASLQQARKVSDHLPVYIMFE
jgi:endonuclease/exonuclease/phosphatase family metal-dependent hydrolase